MGKPKKDSSNMEQLILLLGENQSDWKHKSAIVILIQKFSGVEKSRRPYTCLENMAIDEVETELLESVRVLLNDK